MSFYTICSFYTFRNMSVIRKQLTNPLSRWASPSLMRPFLPFYWIYFFAQNKKWIESVVIRFKFVCYIAVAMAQKKNFLKITKMVSIGGPDDGVINPWYSRWNLFISHPYVYLSKPRIPYCLNRGSSFFHFGSFNNCLFFASCFPAMIVSRLTNHSTPLNLTNFNATPGVMMR